MAQGIAQSYMKAGTYPSARRARKQLQDNDHGQDNDICPDAAGGSSRGHVDGMLGEIDKSEREQYRNNTHKRAQRNAETKTRGSVLQVTGIDSPLNARTP